MCMLPMGCSISIDVFKKLNAMELSPREAVIRSDTQEFPSILWNPEVHHRVHKSPPLIPTQRQTNAIHATSTYSPNIYFNIITYKQN
jgi:hypothetical protein